MTDPSSTFMQSLKRFKNRTLYANIINDRSAVYYTTCISPTDPFSSLEDLPRQNVRINYLPDTEGVLVDPDTPLSYINPPSQLRSDNGHSLSLALRITGDPATHALDKVLGRLRLAILMSLLVPIGSTIYLANAAVQSVLSTRRVRLHSTHPNSVVYDMPLMLSNAQQRAEEMFEYVNSEHENQYLGNDDPNDMIHEYANGDQDGSSTSNLSLSRTPPASKVYGKNTLLLGDLNGMGNINGGREKSNTAHLVDINNHHGTWLNENDCSPDTNCDSESDVPQFPTLALTPHQFDMIRNLDAVGFRKYPVHIRKADHSHAAIIKRVERRFVNFEEADIVVGHWVRGFEI